MDPDEQKTSEELQDLEKAFQEEALSSPSIETPSPSAPVVSQSGFDNTKKSLTETDTKIAEKVTLLKNQAKQELETLKSLKAGIGKKISDIKELEETREKIKKELDKISSLESEVDSITNEAKDELAG